MLNRRGFNASLLAAGAAAALPGTASAREYRGPNVILIRFGGGVRRAETIGPNTWAPYTLNQLAKRGVLIPDMRIEQLDGVETGHAEGTINILSGRYLAYRKMGKGFGDRLEPTEPTLFEYLRSAFDIPSHQVLLVNGEDRPQEEFLTYGVHDHFGVSYRSEMLSLHRFKLHKFQRQMDEASDDAARAEVRAAYDKLMQSTPRDTVPEPTAPVAGFWDNWRRDFGDDGLRNPRGDRLLTALAVRAMDELKPRLMVVNYQDPDYVHWGNASHYTRAIAIIDEGIERIMAAADADPFYRDNTAVVITPDCGRDANPLMDVPYQHHFNSRSAHETWALVAGPGIVRGRVYDRPVDQSALAPTVAAIMGFRADRSENAALSGVFL